MTVARMIHQFFKLWCSLLILFLFDMRAIPQNSDKQPLYLKLTSSIVHTFINFQPHIRHLVIQRGADPRQQDQPQQQHAPDCPAERTLHFCSYVGLRGVWRGASASFSPR